MFKFEHSDFLYLLLAVPVLASLLGGYRWWRQRAVERLGNPGQVYRLLDGLSEGRFWVKNNLVSLSLALLAVAMANPQMGAKKRQVALRSANVFIALDVSNSMLAQDVKPNRLELAKSFGLRLLQSFKNERVGLIFFAGSAYMQTPLTEDFNFAAASLRDASPDYITAQGTAIPLAIELSKRAYETEANAGRALIIITDGENHDDDAVKAAKEARKQGISIYMVGVGTPEGAPVPNTDFGGGGYKHDADNQVVISKMNPALLREVAEAGNGAVYDVRQGDAAVRALQVEVQRLQRQDAEVRSYEAFESYYQWILLPALLLLAFDAGITWRGKNKPVQP